MTMRMTLMAILSIQGMGCSEDEAATAPATATEASGTVAEAPPTLVEVEVVGFGTIQLPAEHTVVEQTAPTDENNNIAIAKFTAGEGDELLTIQTEGTTGRLGVTDEASARSVGRMLTRGGEVQTVTELDNGNFEVYAVRDSEEHYIFVGNDDDYIKCSTTNADNLESCREIAQSLPAPS